MIPNPFLGGGEEMRKGKLHDRGKLNKEMKTHFLSKQTKTWQKRINLHGARTSRQTGYLLRERAQIGVFCL